MTSRRAASVSDKPYVPDELLIQSASSRWQFENSKLADALSAFGPLSKDGQLELVRRLVEVRSLYQLGSARPITPSNESRRLRKIEATTNRLLLQLSIDTRAAEFLRRWEVSANSTRSLDVSIAIQKDMTGRSVRMRLAAACIDAANIAATNEHLGRRSARLDALIFELLWLQQRVQIAVNEVNKRMEHGRGGARRTRTATGLLIQESIAIYAATREQYPRSGNEPGFGAPMLRFIKAVAALVDARADDTAIHEVWRSRKSKRK